MESNDKKAPDSKATKAPEKGGKKSYSTDSIKGAQSSGKIGSSLGDLFADESIGEVNTAGLVPTKSAEAKVPVEAKASAEAKVPLESKVPVESKVPMEASGATEKKEADEGKELGKVETPDQVAVVVEPGAPEDSKPLDAEKAVEEVNVPLKQILPDEEKESENAKELDEKKTLAELKEPNEFKLLDVIKEDPADSVSIVGEVATLDSPRLLSVHGSERDSKVMGEERAETKRKGDDKGDIESTKSLETSVSDGSPFEVKLEDLKKDYYYQEQYFLNVEDNRMSRLRRPSIHTIRSVPSVTSSEDEMYVDIYDAAFIDFDVSRKRKLEKWEDILTNLELERKNELQKDVGQSECTLDIDSDADAANEEQVEEWLVPVNPDFKLKGPKRTAPEHILTAAKLTGKESCVCLQKIFPQPKGFDYTTKPTHFQNGLPPIVPAEPIRKAPLEKIVVRKDYNTVTAKFLLRKGEIYTRAYQRSTKLLEIRINLARIFKIPVEMIILQKDGNTLLDEVVLGTLGIMPCGSVEISLISNEPVAYPLVYDNVLEEIPVAVEVPDVINVTMHLQNGVYKELIVEIFNEAIDKPWLGGYRDIKTLVDYHHAFTQTPPFPKKPKFHRDTQTPNPPVTQYQNTPYNKGTQMSRDDYFVSNDEDRVMTAQPYIPYDDNRSFLKKVITIQRYVRAWLIRKLLKKMGIIYKDEVSKKQDLKRKKDIELEHLLTGNAICNIYPRSRQDFSILYNMVERWRQAEIKRITALKTEAPRKAELCCVLEKEILLLNAIEKHRISVKKEKLEKKEIDFMDKSAHPITWMGAKGKVISMATINTQRAAELRDLYHELNTYTGNAEQRLNVLISVKHAIKTFSCQNAKAFELVALIDRECDVLAHGLKGRQLDFLRKRVAKAFREFMKVPEFNPEGSKYFTEETAYLLSRENMYKCTRCDKYAPRDKFVKTNRMSSIQYCVSCAWLETVGGIRVDLSQFRTIMRALRRDEKKRCCSASIAFIMQEEDFYFLINNIWHGKSPISELDYLPDLRLCRWDIATDWSPWNCILLSNIEMHAHMHLTSPERAYSSAFVADVIKKHQIALMHFKTILKIENL